LARTAFGWIVFVAGALAWGVLFIPLTLLAECFRPGARAVFNAFTSRCLSLYLSILPFLDRISVEERPGAPEPRILVVNHQSWLDPIVVLSLEPGLSGPARGYLFRVPVVRSWLKLGGFYVADEGEPAPLDRMRANVREVVERGGSLLFFPEGTRSRTGEIGPFRRGAFRMAVEHGLAIQPVLIEGLGEILPPGALVVRTPGRSRICVRYLEPRRPPYGEGSTRRVVRRLAEDMRAEMIRELARLRAEVAEERRKADEDE
jgi:1-acyl-sn-glycerol-3-phosphate acyltransferase